MLKEADLALYECKTRARGRYRLYEGSMEAAVLERQRMLTSCSEALAGGHIRPFYQPKVDLRSGEIVGFEALLRLCLADGRILLPDHIGAAFENAPLAAEISDRIIALVLDDMRSWIGLGVPFGHVAINAGAAELRSREFGSGLLARLKRKGVPPSKIQIEITEGVLLGRGTEHLARTFNVLAMAGIKLALDDFGTGFASLAHLKQYPIDCIKIDRQFVRDLQVDPEDGAIVNAILGLARAFDLDVVAEGIEQASQRDFLAALGCQVGQGFFFGPAVPAAEVPALLAGASKATRQAA
jgi:EAL domain-containing protein (putative c-di-GMP-specific phosphodiesterase class I)